MMPFKRFHLVRTLYRASQIGEESSSHVLGISRRSYSNALSNGSEYSFRSFHSYLYKSHNGFPLASVKALTLRSTVSAELYVFINDKRMVTTQVKAPPPAQARQVVSNSKPHERLPPSNNFKADMPDGAQITLSSPGFIYEPYELRQKIPLWRRLFTRSGWRRTKDDVILELKSAYAIAKLRKKGYSRSEFYNEVANMYEQINTLIANGDKKSLRKAVTEKMFSALKNEIKQRESAWSKVYWEMVKPVVSIRTLRARLIGVDPKNLDKAFVQLTLEILAKQKFEAYDSKGAVVAGDKNKEVLVRDIWVFEKSLFHTGAYWRLCGRISSKGSKLTP